MSRVGKISIEMRWHANAHNFLFLHSGHGKVITFLLVKRRSREPAIAHSVK